MVHKPVLNGHALPVRAVPDITYHLQSDLRNRRRHIAHLVLYAASDLRQSAFGTVRLEPGRFFLLKVRVPDGHHPDEADSKFLRTRSVAAEVSHDVPTSQRRHILHVERSHAAQCPPRMPTDLHRDIGGACAHQRTEILDHGRLDVLLRELARVFEVSQVPSDADELDEQLVHLRVRMRACHQLICELAQERDERLPERRGHLVCGVSRVVPGAEVYRSELVRPGMEGPQRTVPGVERCVYVVHRRAEDVDMHAGPFRAERDVEEPPGADCLADHAHRALVPPADLPHIRVWAQALREDVAHDAAERLHSEGLQRAPPRFVAPRRERFDSGDDVPAYRDHRVEIVGVYEVVRVVSGVVQLPPRVVEVQYYNPTGCSVDPDPCGLVEYISTHIRGLCKGVAAGLRRRRRCFLRDEVPEDAEDDRSERRTRVLERVLVKE